MNIIGKEDKCTNSQRVFPGNMPSLSKSESVAGIGRPQWTSLWWFDRLTMHGAAYWVHRRISRTVSATFASAHNMLFPLQVITVNCWVLLHPNRSAML